MEEVNKNDFRIDEQEGKLYTINREMLSKTNFKVKDNGKLYAEIGG